MLQEGLIVATTVGVLLVGVVAGCAPILLVTQPRRRRSTCRRLDFSGAGECASPR